MVYSVIRNTILVEGGLAKAKTQFSPVYYEVFCPQHCFKTLLKYHYVYAVVSFSAHSLFLQGYSILLRSSEQQRDSLLQKAQR